MADENVAKKDPPVTDAAEQKDAPKQEVKAEEPKAVQGEAAGETLLPKAEEKQVEATKEEWPKYDDPSLGAAVELMKAAGLNYEDSKAFFKKAGETGKASDVDFKGLEAKMGKAQATLVMAGLKQYEAEQTQFAQATITDVMTVLGGKESYMKLKDWVSVREAADPAFAKDLVAYRQMISSGGVQAKAAAIALKQLYTENPNNSGLNNKMVEGDKSVNAVEGQPLGRAEYNKLLKEAYDKRDDAEVTRLNARRKAGIKQGVR